MFYLHGLDMASGVRFIHSIHGFVIFRLDSFTKNFNQVHLHYQGFILFYYSILQ